MLCQGSFRMDTPTKTRTRFDFENATPREALLAIILILQILQYIGYAVHSSFRFEFKYSTLLWYCRVNTIVSLKYFGCTKRTHNELFIAV